MCMSLEACRRFALVVCLIATLLTGAVVAQELPPPAPEADASEQAVDQSTQVPAAFASPRASNR